MTRSFVQYFTDDSVDPIRRALSELQVEFEDRARHIDEADRVACDQRLRAVDLAIARLSDRVPE